MDFQPPKMGAFGLWIETQAFLGGASGKELACGCRRLSYAGLIPESRRSPREGYGNPLQCSVLENPLDRGAWLATDHGVAKSRT